MNRLVGNVLAVFLLSSMHGCRETLPTHTVCLVDVSKSITLEGYESEFKAVDDLVDGMHRGDRLTVIPITGNAAADTPGAVVTITAPIHRQAYDGDLLAFRVEAHRDIQQLRDTFSSKPAGHTDILGALDIAQEEFDAESGEAGGESRRSLYIFSDFVEEDRTYHFLFVQKDGAADLAGQLRREHHLSLSSSATVRLIKLQSSDARNLSPDEQGWVRDFWSAYFLPNGAHWMPLDVSAAEKRTPDRIDP